MDLLSKVTNLYTQNEKLSQKEETTLKAKEEADMHLCKLKEDLSKAHHDVDNQ